jgi:ferrous iron transport protein B
MTGVFVMGLTSQSTGAGVLDFGRLHISKETSEDKIVALAGNPNVGKSTVFNELTGLHQHTGNWPGKTVTTAYGKHRSGNETYILVDLPGTYSLMANSAEEEVARDFICFGGADVVAIVADATCLERNLNLVFQVMEITPKVVLCVNLMDEAHKKKIRVDLAKLSSLLGIPVIGTSARSGKGLDKLMEKIKALSEGLKTTPFQTEYEKAVEHAISMVKPLLIERGCPINARWLAIKLLEGDGAVIQSLQQYMQFDVMEMDMVLSAVEKAKQALEVSGFTREQLKDHIATKMVENSEAIAKKAVTFEKKDYAERDRRIDKFLTSKATGIPVMLLLLFGALWLTITGANYPSALLAEGLFWIEAQLARFFVWISAPAWVSGLLVEGVYRTLAWVVSVMLPPMAIFFPLFTLLEDSGYLPRIAFNLDNYFRKACAHGKQALTMCMGFGCNAAGIIGCRIIDSPRERMIAILTNNFVPCNGRFPTLIAIITMFFAGAVGGAFRTVVSTLMLTAVIVLGIVATMLVSKLLSKTILKGMPSSFHLELPPYRRPQIGKVIVRSIFDRTLFVLSRAVAVAAPAGFVLWLLANVHVGGASLLAHSTGFLDPFARLLGLDGIILMAFILGFPANEIVVPIMIMGYMATGSLTEIANLTELRMLFINNGWTWLTAVCVMLFCLMHWPCGTTCLTVKKETQSVKWTLVSFFLPTVIGMLLCFVVASTVRLLGLV